MLYLSLDQFYHVGIAVQGGQVKRSDFRHLNQRPVCHLPLLSLASIVPKPVEELSLYGIRASFTFLLSGKYIVPRPIT